ncbi:hypothetical protein BN1723_004938 [Verticillium longisporum]|uniref:Uncharacterized protein n=1 Tax=Verticillium longisporum TaxID=100787 RepID=A0A0G4N2M5_VERLO|nr:hypothetical protein BN1723_004938 [Verticillium longisporum]
MSVLAGCAIYVEGLLEHIDDMRRALSHLANVTFFKVISIRSWRDFVGISSSDSTTEEAFGILYWTCFTNISERAAAILAKGQINIRDQSQTYTRRILLHDATFHGSFRVVRIFLDHGMDVNEKDNAGQTPLIVAVKVGHPEIARHLLEFGSEATLRDKDGWDALFYAASGRKLGSGRVDLVSYLLSAGCDPFSENPILAQTPLAWAILYGDHEMFARLLTGAISTTAHRSDGTWAFEPAWVDYFKRLVLSAEVPTTDTILQTWLYAAETGNEAVIDFLLAAGAKPDWQDKFGRTILMMIVEEDSLGKAKTMAEEARGAAAIQDTAIRTLASEIDRKKISAIKKILDSGADPNLADKQGYNALHRTLRLLQRPESRNAQRPSSTHEQSRSPIYTSELYEMDVIKLLLWYGANVNTRIFTCETQLDAGAYINHRTDNGETPLDIAVECNRAEIVDLLLSAGSDFDVHVYRQKTPLTIAVERGLIEETKLLIDAGTDVNYRTDRGETPLTIAVECNRVEVAKLLIDAGADASNVILSEVDDEMRKVLVGET